MGMRHTPLLEELQTMLVALALMATLPPWTSVLDA